MIRTHSNKDVVKRPYYVSHLPYAFGEEARARAKHDPGDHRAIRYTRTIGSGSIAVHHIFHTVDERKVTLYIMQGIADRGFFLESRCTR